MYITTTIFIIIILAISIFSYWRIRKYKIESEKREKEMQRKMYELAILKELAERTGYSLNLQNIVDIITGSLHQFLEYVAVSYMLLQPEKVIFKVHLEESVSRTFINNIQDRMLKSLSALLNKEFKKSQVEEVLSGSILVDELDVPVQSFFNIPLVIAEKVVGVITVAHTKLGLYKEEEMTILYKITQQASLAVSRLQEVIAAEQQKLNAMVSSMTEGVVMTDTDYRLVVVNPAAKRAVGIEENEEADIFKFIDNLEGKFDIRGKLEESVKLNKVLIADEIFINNSFFKIFVSPVKGLINLDEEGILGGVVIFQDITHEKEVEKMRDDFTSMMVHELRSPLSGIKKMAEFIGKDNNLPEPKKLNEYLNLIYQNSSDMLGLVNDLLDVARLESGKFELYKEVADVSSIINDRIMFYKPLAEEAKISLSIKLAKNIPKKINIDKEKIIQVLNNLISNALKFTPKGGNIDIQAIVKTRSINLEEEAKKSGLEWRIKKDYKKLNKISDALIIAITDNGEGISNENMKLLFNKFVQFKSSAEKKRKGTGLGLVIAEGIIKAHNGIIGVESEEGAGSTFYFTLPLK
ncbi:MAG: ATP-binding protein [Patescibacteria group bacterium]